jgi:flagellar assembly protein FliH
MSREVLSSPEYQYSQPGYLIDNKPWQTEIQKRLKAETEKTIRDARPTLGADEFQPLYLPENSEATEAETTVKPPEPTAEEILRTAKQEAEESARSIEQAAKKTAFEIVEQARWEANDILAKAKEDAEKESQSLKEAASETGRQEGLKEGQEKGYQQGFDKGRQEGADTYSGSLKNWDHLLKETVDERKKHLFDLQPMIVELVGTVLARCLKTEAEQNRQMVVGFVQEALKKAQDRVHLKVHLNPEDIGEVEANRGRLQLSVGVGEIALVPDMRIPKGGCLLETEAGSVDLRIDTIVSQVQESLSKAVLQK